MSARDWLERRAGSPSALYDRIVGRLDASGLEAARRALVAGVRGRVLELGCGTGGSFRHYPAEARVTGVEPEPTFRAAAARRARDATARISVVAGDAHDLPFPDGSFDAVVAELMLCSVTSPEAALREALRVTRPGGSLRLLEHVRHGSAWVAHLQDVVDPLWTSLEGRGCRLGRDTPRTVREVGFVVEAMEPVALPPGVDWLFPIVTVRARRP